MSYDHDIVKANGWSHFRCQVKVKNTNSVLYPFTKGRREKINEYHSTMIPYDHEIIKINGWSHFQCQVKVQNTSSSVLPSCQGSYREKKPFWLGNKHTPSSFTRKIDLKRNDLFYYLSRRSSPGNLKKI